MTTNIKSTFKSAEGWSAGHKIVLAGKEYYDMHNIEPRSVSAYIQCAWFDKKQVDFMEKGLEALAGNLTFNLANSHHPLSHQYKDINVNDHPEVMEDFEWQQCTVKMDIEAMKLNPIGVALYMPSDEDEGIAWESGWLCASHKPNLVVIPDDETNVPINLMMIENTRIITLSELKSFDFHHDLIYKPYKGKIF